MTPEEPVPTLREPPGLAEGQVLAERYQIERRIGGGGMGEVFLARHLRTGRPVAVKLLGTAAAREPDSLQRFEQEARVLGSLGHPGIVGIHDFDTTPEGRPYLVMDYLQGEELAARLDREGALPWSEVSRIFEEVSGALHAAHGLGVLHRDLKPGNLFLARSAAAPERAVLLDFGLSKDLSAEEKRLTRTGMIMGTPLYMSPEQARGQTLDVRSDVYSLAAVLYEMVSGRPPFEGASWTAILSALLLEPPAPFGQALLASLPPQVDGALRRALSKDPAFRPPDVLGFATEVLGRAPIWAAALGVAAAPAERVAAGRGFVTGPTAWADSGDVAPEAPGSARTLPSGSPAPALSLPSPAARPVADGVASPSGRRSPRRLLLLGVLGLLGGGLLAAAVLAWPSGTETRRVSGPGRPGPLARSPGDAALEGTVGALPRAVPIATSDAGRLLSPGATVDAGLAVPPRRAAMSPPAPPTPVPGQRAAVVPPAPPDRGAERVPLEGKPPAGPPVGPAAGQPDSPSAQPPRRPLTEADVLAMLPANEQAAIGAMKVSDWAGCLRATAKPPQSERILQMRIACANSGGRRDVVVSTCQVLLRRFPRHPMSQACVTMIQVFQPMSSPQGGAPKP